MPPTNPAELREKIARPSKPTDGVSEALLRQRAHARVRSQIKAGLMERPSTCEACGNSPGLGRDGRSLLQAHHHNGYLRPLDVQWLCVQCHRDETPCNPARGVDAAPAKLTEDAVREIRSSPLGITELAAIYGVTTGAVWQARKGRTWAHVK